MPQAVEDEGDRARRERGERDGMPHVQAPERIAAGASGFGLCHSGGGTNCVVDGDTIWLAGQNIRIADIDAPETHEPRCAAEQAPGDRATQRLHHWSTAGRSL